jgi:hypothetical protein
MGKTLMDDSDKYTGSLKATVGVLVGAFAVLCIAYANHDHHVPSLESDIHSLRWQLDKLQTHLVEEPAGEPTPHDWEGIANLVKAAEGSVAIEFDGVSIAVQTEDRR